MMNGDLNIHNVGIWAWTKLQIVVKGYQATEALLSIDILLSIQLRQYGSIEVLVHCGHCSILSDISFLKQPVLAMVE